MLKKGQTLCMKGLIIMKVKKPGENIAQTRSEKQLYQHFLKCCLSLLYLVSIACFTFIY